MRNGEQAEQWDRSYRNKDNFVFYPHEEIVRFVSRHVRKKVGLREFKDQRPLGRPARGLDVGCGIGRHMVFMWDFGIQPYGVDLSGVALETARAWTSSVGVPPDEGRFHLGSVTKLPWTDGFFDLALSHGVLDSMPFEIAAQAVPEIHRVLKNDGLFYCDLVSSDDSRHTHGFDGEEIVESALEKGTIQSYFTPGKIARLFDERFETLELVHVKRESVLSCSSTARFHAVLKKR